MYVSAKWAETLIRRNLFNNLFLVALIAFTYMFDNKDLYEVEVNLFVALILDIFVVATIKGENQKTCSI